VTASLFAGEAGRVAVVDRDAAAAAETVTRIAARGGEAAAFECNIASQAAVRGMVDAAAARFGRVDVLVNNAAMFLMKGTEEADAADWEQEAESLFADHAPTRFAARIGSRVAVGVPRISSVPRATPNRAGDRTNPIYFWSINQNE
jgi:NAD(P)-dependent dehydrogenase (short-subunit alcohol dehydrogenase family)